MPSKKNAEAKRGLISFSDEFYSDLQENDFLHAVLVRSPYEKGKIISVSCNLPENCFLILTENLPSKNYIQTLGKKTPLFCEKEVLYKGQPIGVLCGPDLNQLYELREKIEIILDSGGGENEEKTEKKVESKETDWILASRVIETGFFSEKDKDVVNEKFENADFCVSGDYTSSVGKRFFGETEGAFVVYKAGKIKVFSPTLWISHLRENLLETTGLSEDKIFICHTKTCSTNSASLYLNTEIACQIAVCSVVLKKSVKLVFSREEQKYFVDKAAPVFISHKAAVTKDGKITALDVKITLDCGVYNPLAEEIVDRLTITSCGIYDIDNLRIVTEARSNPSLPTSFDMGRIDSHTFFAIENLMNKISFMTGMPAVDLRLSNIRLSPVQKTTMPFLFQPGKVYECLDAVSGMSDFSRKHTVYRVSELERKKEKKQTYSPFKPPLRGIGLACAFEGSVYFGTHFDRANVSVSVTLNKDDSITIYSLPVSEAIKNIWVKMALKTLELPSEKVKITENFDNLASIELPEIISRDIGVMTNLLSKCLETVKSEKGKKEAPFTVKKTLSPATKKLWSKSEFRGMPFHSQSFACAVLELEFNPESFREEIRQISICVDGGTIISKKAATQTIKLEVQKCLKELVKYEHLACPVINIKLIESEKEPKQIGSLVSSILPAAYSSALSQSLSLTVNSLPLKTETLYDLIQTAAEKKHGSDDEEFFDALSVLLADDNGGEE